MSIHTPKTLNPSDARHQRLVRSLGIARLADRGDVRLLLFNSDRFSFNDERKQ